MLDETIFSDLSQRREKMFLSAFSYFFLRPTSIYRVETTESGGYSVSSSLAPTARERHHMFLSVAVV
jgi:hypothetical protein